MGEGGGGEEKRSFSPSALSLFRFHLSPFPQKRLILRLTLKLISEVDTVDPRSYGHQCEKYIWLH